MTDAFVETTILTDYLLKRDGSEKRVATAIRQYERGIIPQFAWKEFKRGPLNNFVWAHNKLTETKSLLDMLAALQRMSRSPHRYLTSTAMQSVHSAFAALFSENRKQLQQAYGDKANPDAVHADLMRLELKRVIYSSWNSRVNLFGGPYNVLSCYPDRALSEARGRISTEPRDCPKAGECCLKGSLVSRTKDLSTVRAALKTDAARQEVARRVKVIRQLEKHPTSLMGTADCRSFGDAYFVMACPGNAVIVTTNLRDIEPMASALGIAVHKWA
jgi:hypothetical protein